MNANYYEKSYSSRRKKSVRFNVEEKGVGSKEEEDEEEASSDGCEHENGTPTGFLCTKFLTKCIGELFYSHSSQSRKGHAPDTSLEDLLADIMREEETDSDFDSDSKPHQRAKRKMVVSNSKSLLNAYDKYTKNMNYNKMGSGAATKMRTGILYISIHQTVISSTSRILTIVITPYPMIKTLEQVTDAFVKLQITPQGSELEQVSPAEVLILPSAASLTSMRLNFLSSKSSVLEELGYRENFVEFYRSFSPDASESSLEGNKEVRDYCRRVFCDFSFMDVLASVSVKTVVLLMLEIGRNRSIVIHSCSNEKIVRVIVALITFMHPLEIHKFYRVSSCFDLCSAAYFVLHANNSIPFLVGCNTSEAIILQAQKRMSTEPTHKQFSMIDLDSESVLLPGEETYFSVSCSRLLRVPPQEELHELITSYQYHSSMYRQEKCCTDTEADILQYNFYISSMFKSFLNGSLMKHIPSSLKLYPDKDVVSCDVAALMQQTLHEVSASSQNLDDYSIMCERKQFVEKVVDSPSFVDLIVRHGYALCYLR